MHYHLYNCKNFICFNNISVNSLVFVFILHLGHSGPQWCLNPISMIVGMINCTLCFSKWTLSPLLLIPASTYTNNLTISTFHNPSCLSALVALVRSIYLSPFATLYFSARGNFATHVYVIRAVPRPYLHNPLPKVGRFTEVCFRSVFI